jgi:hypothetical protein
VSITGRPLLPQEAFVIIKANQCSLIYGVLGYPEGLRVFPQPQGIAVRNVPSLTGWPEPVKWGTP